jgi:F-type H+-transporting ATPase subunit a
MIGIAGRLWWVFAQAHGASAEGATQAGEPDIATAWNEHMMAEVSDAHHFLVPLVNREIALPQFPPLHIGSFAIDLSPTKHVIYVMIAATLCAATMIWVARKTHGKGAERAPKGLANMIEAFVIYLRDEVAMRNIGKGGERYVPFILTLFFFILYMNVLGLVPFGASATGNVGITAALAVLSLVAIEVGGLLHIGPKAYLGTIVYIPKGLNWFWSIVMAIVMTPVELVAKLARIFALAIRLFANMIAGHLVILSLVGLVFVAGAAGGVIRYVIWPAPVLMAVAIMLMEIFIAFLQAYIFAMLTAVFIGLVRHPH